MVWGKLMSACVFYAFLIIAIEANELVLSSMVDKITTQTRLAHNSFNFINEHHNELHGRVSALNK